MRSRNFTIPDSRLPNFTIPDSKLPDFKILRSAPWLDDPGPIVKTVNR